MNTRLVAISLLVLSIGRSAMTPAEAQRPPGKRGGKAARAAAQSGDSSARAAGGVAAQRTDLTIVQVSPAKLPQDPLRLRIQDAVRKGLQAAKLSVAVQSAGPGAAAGAAPDSSTPGRGGRRRKPNATGPAAAPPAASGGSQTGFAALQSAVSGVLSAGGQKWGGHKMKAAGFINQALAACGQAKTAPGQVQAGTGDPSAAMLAALQQLASAKTALASDPGACGGAHDQAIALIGQAQSEVQASIDFAKSH